MKHVVIENPVINSPYEEPMRHFEFDEVGITSNIAGARRSSSYFVPVPKPRKTGGKTQQPFDDWRSDRIKSDENWRQLPDKAGIAATPPVIIVVCNNTNVSKMVFDYIAGWEKPMSDGSSVAVPAKLPLFSNVQVGQFIHRPNTFAHPQESRL